MSVKAKINDEWVALAVNTQSIAVDNTLSQENCAADAQAVGSALNKMTEYIDNKQFVSYADHQNLSAMSRAVAKNNVGVYVQHDEPADAVDGDVWIDTDDDMIIPGYTEDDNGKFLRIVNGVATWVNLLAAEDGVY